MKNEKLYLVHIIEASAKIKEYLPETLEKFEQNSMARDAIIKHLANITESASNLEKMSKATHPNIPWEQIRGMRNILVHDYLGDLSYEEVWKTVHNDLPVLVEVARSILKEKYNIQL
jgi:uncharacterized protein with HEPN domain